MSQMYHFPSLWQSSNGGHIMEGNGESFRRRDANKGLSHQ